MPQAPKRPCKMPGCSSLEITGGYCVEHQAQVVQASAKYDQRRGSASARGYNSQWRKIRHLFLIQHPLCHDPHGIHNKAGREELATDVHHITPLREGGTHDACNLMSLCHSCHSKITAQERRG